MNAIEKAMDSLDLCAIKQRCRGVAFVTVLLTTSFFGFVFFSPLFLSVFILRLSCARFVVDTIASGWFAFAVATFELLYGVKIVVRGDAQKLNQHASSIIVMNHRTRMDWLFYFAVQVRYGTLRRFKISLKDMLRHAPGPGWAMQAAHFLFLKRNWESDKRRIEQFLEHFQDVKCRPQLLLFPEGTDLQQESLLKSKRYAKKNDLQEYQYVLHPRTTGFTSIFDYMKTHNNLEQVIDVTIAYPQNVCQDESDLLSGNIPREIVFTVNCFNIDEIEADSETALSKWLEHRWKLKENYLRNFYEGKDDRITTHSNGFHLDQHTAIERATTLTLAFSLLVYASVTAVTVFAIVYSIYFRWIFLSLCLLNTCISSTVGFDNLFARLSV